MKAIFTFQLATLAPSVQVVLASRSGFSRVVASRSGISGTTCRAEGVQEPTTGLS